MDKEKIINGNKRITVEKEEDYGYDFVPELANYLNIDEQKETAKRIEDIGKKRGK